MRNVPHLCYLCNPWLTPTAVFRINGWWGYFRLTERRWDVTDLSGRIPPTHAQMLLAKMAPPKRAAQRLEAAWTTRRNPRHGLQRERSVGDRPALGDDECAEEQDAETLWVYPAVGNGDDIGRPPTQPPDAENRTSGGVEGSRGAIPVSPSDPEAMH